MNIKQRITHNLLNIPGWRTKRHIVVIESDDWGAIRMPSREVYEKLLSEGYRVDKNVYERTDSLARENDLEALFEVLKKHKDQSGNHPVFTINCAVANPDFQKIQENDFKEYYYEPFTETLKRYPGCEHSFELWQQGMKEGLFHPQFHGREHLNVARWMNALQMNDSDTRYVFRYGLMGLFPKNDYSKGNVFQVALDDSQFQHQPLNQVLMEGLDLFEQIFGYKSETFIAPGYTWSSVLEKTLNDKGVCGIQGMVYQQVPGRKPIRHFMGTKNQYGQIYTIRNCFFEPTQGSDIEDCLYRIRCAFHWRKPAIISAHRINFIGAIREKNRRENVYKLDMLLSEVLRRWPDVEFLSSDQLVEQIKNNKA